MEITTTTGSISPSCLSPHIPTLTAPPVTSIDCMGFRAPRPRAPRRQGVSAVSRRRPLLIAFLVASSFTTMAMASPSAPATKPSLAELQEQVRQLQGRIQQLEDQQQAVEHAGERATVTNDTVQRVLHDADQHSKLMQVDGSLTAGFSDDHFFLASTDGNWLLVPHVLLQFRNVTNWDEDG